MTTSDKPAPVILALPGKEDFSAKVAIQIGADIGQVEIRKFPDEETYVRIDSDLANRDVVLLASLDRPDMKVLPLLFTAATARELGAASVGLAAPYLSYMRQDKRFRAGEGVTSSYFASLLSRWIDWVVTIDPHLHRRSALDEIYAVPTQVLHAAPLISTWIRENVSNPLLIGPDEESLQWVASVAAGEGVAEDTQLPYVVLEKLRHGDRDIEIAVPDLEIWQGHTPVLVDDIISTARTMIETLGHLKRAGLNQPICIGVHGIFAGDAFEQLSEQAAQIVTTNAVFHQSNGIDISHLMADGIRSMHGSRL